MVNVPATPQANPVNPLALSVEELARMLSAAGGKRVAAEQLQKDIDAGAPVLANGRINLVHYAAWLNQQISRSET